MPLVALTTLRASVFQMGVLNALEFVPYVALGLFAGVWVDRLPRRSILITADLARALILALVPAAALLGLLGIELLFAVALAVGIAGLFFEFAYQAYLPALIPEAALVEGNSKLAQSSSVMRIVGPTVAGFLIQLVTAPLAVLVDAASFLVSAASLWWIKGGEGSASRAGRRAMLPEIREGLSFVFRHPVIRALAINNGLGNYFSSMTWAVYFVYVARDLALPPAVIGIVLAVGGPGSLFAAATTDRVARRLGVGRAMVFGQGLMVTGNAFLAASVLLSSAALPLLFVSAISLGLGATYYNVTLYSMRQALTPTELRGRTVASVRLLTVGVMPLGALSGGALGEWIGVGPTIEIAFIGAALGVVPLLFSEVPQMRTVPSAETAMPATSAQR